MWEVSTRCLRFPETSALRLLDLIMRRDGLTSAFKRSESSGWYERASRERGRCLSTSRAIVDVIVVVCIADSSVGLNDC
jgi:hypothetical protein